MDTRDRIMVDMSATLIHHGHVRLLTYAANIGRVIVGLVTDEEIRNTKGYEPELNFEQRREILLAFRQVDEVVAAPWLITDVFLELHKIKYLVHGSDNVNPVSHNKLIIRQRTEGISSTKIREHVIAQSKSR